MTEKRLQKKLAKIQKKGEQQKKIRELEDTYAIYMPEKKTRKVSNMMLVVIVTAITLYTTAALWIQFATAVPVDSTLTTCFYAFWGSELVALATLKTSKIIKGTEYEMQ